ncbi:MAG: UBP-type zinc finger domain-containing protein, partial [Bryobacteraceae bacterium]
MKTCAHVREAKDLQPSERVCKECIQMGDSWVHLRICLTCGHVGCCDSSKNKHATKHFHRVQHPMVR